MPGPYPDAHTVGTCPLCGKQCYRSKASAKRAARVLYPGATRRTHKCGDYWHFTSMTARQVANLKDWRAAGHVYQGES